MNSSMLPQRSSVATLGYGTGTTMLNYQFNYFVFIVLYHREIKLLAINSIYVCLLYAKTPCLKRFISMFE